MKSTLSYEEYVQWCKSRFPASDPASAPESYSKTMLASAADSEECPVTVRSATDHVVVTPRPQRSR